MPAPFIAEATVSTGFVVVAILCVIAVGVVILVGLFGRGPRYKITSPGPESLDSDEFLYMLEALTDSKVNRHSSLQVLTNGENFYRAELDAIRAAEQTINLEAYIFQRGEIAGAYVEALTERARAGVQVKLLVDAVGSAGLNDSSFASLCEAGGQVAWYIGIPGGEVLHIFNVHLGTAFVERRHQARLLLSLDVLRAEDLSGPRIVVGDFNEWTAGLASRLMAEEFHSVDLRQHIRRSRTYPGILPLMHLDHFYFDQHLVLEGFALHRTRKSLIASDHLPMVAQFRLPAAESVA